MFSWNCIDDLVSLSHDPQYQDVTIICQDGKLCVNSFLLATLFPGMRNTLHNSDEEVKIIMPEIFSEVIQKFFKLSGFK